MFTARYALNHYMKGICLVFKGLVSNIIVTSFKLC
jgi:hypothetical protein